MIVFVGDKIPAKSIGHDVCARLCLQRRRLSEPKGTKLARYTSPLLPTWQGGISKKGRFWGTVNESTLANPKCGVLLYKYMITIRIVLI